MVKGMTDTADEPIIASRLEASLCAGWWLLFVAALLAGEFIRPVATYPLLLLAVLDLAALQRRVGRRLGTNSNKVLRHWMGYRAQVQAWRVIFGGKSTKVGPAAARPT